MTSATPLTSLTRMRVYGSTGLRVYGSTGAHLQLGGHDERDDAHELDEDVERGAGGVLEGVPDGVAAHRRLVVLRACAPSQALIKPFKPSLSDSATGKIHFSPQFFAGEFGDAAIEPLLSPY
eukprot:1178704-Prorocentrum_minimum.AAC.2